MKQIKYAIVLAALLAIASASNAATLVTDTFEDGNYNASPTWTVGAGTATMMPNDPGTTNGNDWVKLTGSHGNIQTDTRIVGTAGYAQVAITARILFASTNDSGSNYASFYFISDDSNSYMKFLFFLDNNTYGDTYTYCRKSGSSTYSTPEAATTGMNAADTWYDVKCVWNSNDYYEMWVDDMDDNNGTVGLQLVSSGTDTTDVVELGDLENVRCYTRGTGHGFDDIVVTPEPATMTLLLLGLPFALRRRR